MKVITYLIFSFLLLSSLSCDDRKNRIDKELKSFFTLIEMTHEDMPYLRGFYDVSFFAKKEENKIKWILSLEPAHERVGKQISDYLVDTSIKKDEGTSHDSLVIPLPSIIVQENNAVFYIIFLDEDGFELGRTTAGLFLLDRDDIANSLSKRVRAKVSSLGAIKFHGETDIDNEVISKIRNITIQCKFSEELSNLLKKLK